MGSGERMKQKKEVVIPELSLLEAELKRERYKSRYWTVFRSSVYILITVAAVAVLVATLWLPVLQIYGSSMTPTMDEGNIVISVKSMEYEHGDIIAFYYNNKILVKRVIATAGEWIDMKPDGTVYVNGIRKEEDYIQDKAYGDCDVVMPYQVPESRVFVMGDHRSVSVDSRSTGVGCIAEEQIVGKIVFKIWPLDEIGKIQ